MVRPLNTFFMSFPQDKGKIIAVLFFCVQLQDVDRCIENNGLYKEDTGIYK